MNYGNWDRKDWHEYEIVSGNERRIEDNLFTTFDDRAPSQKDIEEKLLQLAEEFPSEEISRLTTKAMKQQGSDQAYQEINRWLKDLVANIVATSAAEEERYMERLNERLDYYAPKHGYLRAVLNRNMPTRHQRKKVAEGLFKPE